MADPVKFADTNVAQRTNTLAAAEMLRTAMPIIVLDKVMTPFRMPKNKGDNVKFRRRDAFTAATTPLVEGVTPSAGSITFTDYTATLKQYGAFVRFTDKVDDLHEDPIGQLITQGNGENVGRTLEALNWGVLRAGTNVFYANGTQRTDVNTPVNYNKLHKAIRALRAQKADMFRDVLSGSPNFATQPIEAAYIGIAHTDMEHDIRALPGFIPASQYGSRTLIDRTEIGAFENIRFLLSPDLTPFPDAGGAKLSCVSTTGTSADVYPLLICGKDNSSVVALRGSKDIGSPLLVTSQNPGIASDSDPLGQRGFEGWKTWWAAKITNEAWVARIECGVTAL